MDIFGDFGVAGGFDQTANPYQDNQLCINWFPEIAASDKAKTKISLLGTPGLVQLVTPTPNPPGTLWPIPSPVTNLPVRGFCVLPGNQAAIAVIASTVYLVSITSAGSLTTPGVLTMTSVGTLLSNANPVSMRHNGLGGQVVIVDGLNGYFYDISTQALTIITDPNFLGADTVAFIDGWWIFNEPNTQTFYTNAQPYALTFDASYFANKDAAADRLVAVWESKEELWLLGELTTEIWYDAGNQYFPFARLVGTMLQIGCKAKFSVARLTAQNQDGLMWLGRSDRGENVVIRTNGFSAQVVSTPAVANAIAQYTTTADAIAYTYQEGTHEFYVLTFPTQDTTWVYDSSMPLEMAWHQRLSYDPYAKTYHRHRSNAYMNFAGMRVVGDYQNGTLLQMTRAAYTDNGWPILAKRRAPYIWDEGPRGRVFMASLQVEFSPGVGTPQYIGEDPVANLRISRDGTTFGQRWPASLGKTGEYRNRVIWRRLGFGRSNLVELEVIAPVNRDIVGATLKAFSEPEVPR